MDTALKGMHEGLCAAGWEGVEGKFLIWERPRVLTSDTTEPHRFVTHAGGWLSHRDYETRTQTLGLF